MRNGNRCDLCYYPFSTGDESWTYLTPSTGTLAQAQAGEAFWAEDLRWGLCQDCHAKVSAWRAGTLSQDEAITRTLGANLVWQMEDLQALPDQPTLVAALTHTKNTVLAFFGNVVGEPVQEVEA